MQFLAERFLYLPSLGIFLGASLLLTKGFGILRIRDFLLYLLVFAAGVNLLQLTVSRNRVWKNEISLWEETLRQSPGSRRARENLAFAYLHAGETDKAIPLWESMAEKSRAKEKPLTRLAVCYYKKNDIITFA